MKNASKLFKFAIGWLIVLGIRLIPFRPANFEPMASVIMPYSKHYKNIASFLFAFLGIFVFDLISSKIGTWTLITGITYGLIALASSYFFKNREGNIKNFLSFGIAGTLVYDAITGLSIGPLFFGQSFMEALLGQIPFTAMHILGTVFFSLTLSPLLYRWVVKNEELEINSLVSKIKLATKM